MKRLKGKELEQNRGRHKSIVRLAHEPAHVLQQQGDGELPLQRIPRGAMIPHLPEPSQEELLREALRTEEIGDIKRVRNFSGATERQRLSFISILLNQGWVGPFDEITLALIWNSFGSRLPEVADNNIALWNRCLRRGMDPSDIRELNNMRSAFERDVKTIARNYMEHNLQYAWMAAFRISNASFKL